MEASYKLRCNVVGHEKDVRALAPTIFPLGGFVSGSRDITARIWTPNEHDIDFMEAHRVSGHSNFIAAVCVMPPDDTYPHGLIFTGSNDSTILAFSLESPEPVLKLEGHTGTVCSLATGKFGTLLSGSWDTTAKIWLNAKCMMTLSGHSAAVWAVAILPEQGILLTGSADKTIKMWKAGRCEKTFSGHEDCVRGLAVLSGAEFLSCSNDATVRRWLVSGECVHTYYGHSNYIYSIAVLPNGEDFVTGGEDRTLKVWKSGECVQTIAHPTESVWAVCCLSNGDVVTGASDGIIRVFSTCPDRVAAPEIQVAFEEQVAASTIPTQIGDIKVSDLPGPEALLNPGDRDGQSKMVREDNSVQMYNWSARESRWVKIGAVVGSSGGSQASSGKVLYEGKEYDYVFDVELQEGSPPLKLPYNIAEDPWFAAQNFLHKNDLSQLFLDQVANFIQEQTKGVTLGQAQPKVSDPFTGGTRYVPGSDSSGSLPQSQGADPFTGQGRYIPSSGSASSKPADPFTGSSSYQPSASSSSTQNTYFPRRQFLLFEAVNPAQIMGKVKEFNEKVEPGLKLDVQKVNDLNTKFTAGSLSEQDLPMLVSLLQWPADVLFPVLDILRAVIRQPAVNQYFCSTGLTSLEEVIKYISPGASAPNQMLSLRVMCNLFSQSTGEKFNMKHRDTILGAAVNCLQGSTKNIQVALTTLLLNYSVSLVRTPDEEFKPQCVSACIQVLSHPQLDPEAIFRILVALGTLLEDDPTSLAVARSLDIQNLLQPLSNHPEPKKVSECSTLLLSLLS
ncbi:phospholipase A-2-activating protein-like [Liolophura sinensis]|uniref:phospholipase A-2-activating protein-like n=1 Tax=Liolophura sinensis TaxID=3198878 RepID=UPI003158AB78